MSPEKTEEKKAPKDKKKMNPMMLYGILFLASFGLVFASTYFYVTKVQRPQLIEEARTQQALIEADTVKTEMIPADSTQQTAEGTQDSLDFDNIRSEQTMLERMRMVEQISILRDQLEQKQGEVEELSAVLDNQDSLAYMLDKLREENTEKSKQVEYLQETLPENVASRIAENQQNDEPEADIAGYGGGQAPVQQQQQPEEEKKGIRKLAKIYGAMKANEASLIMENMTDAQIVDIMIRMKDREAAKILTSFQDKARAAKISQRMQEQ